MAETRVADQAGKSSATATFLDTLYVHYHRMTGRAVVSALPDVGFDVAIPLVVDPQRERQEPLFAEPESLTVSDVAQVGQSAEYQLAVSAIFLWGQLAYHEIPSTLHMITPYMDAIMLGVRTAVDLLTIDDNVVFPEWAEGAIEEAYRERGKRDTILAPRWYGPGARLHTPGGLYLTFRYEPFSHHSFGQITWLVKRNHTDTPLREIGWWDREVFQAATQLVLENDMECAGVELALIDPAAVALSRHRAAWDIAVQELAAEAHHSLPLTGEMFPLTESDPNRRDYEWDTSFAVIETLSEAGASNTLRIAARIAPKGGPSRRTFINSVTHRIAGYWHPHGIHVIRANQLAYGDPKVGEPGSRTYYLVKDPAFGKKALPYASHDIRGLWKPLSETDYKQREKARARLVVEYWDVHRKRWERVP